MDPKFIKKFLLRNPEKQDFNQYWYSSRTIETLANEVKKHLQPHERCAFLSTPSIYYAFSPEERQEYNLFDFDAKFENEPGFVLYDFNKPDDIPKSLHHEFDMVVIDPPFITKEVWEKYTAATEILLRDAKKSKILLTTIEENQQMIQQLLGCSPQIYKPSIPNLVYQYCIYTNYESDELMHINPELED